MDDIDWNLLPKNPPEARAAKHKYYFTGYPCIRGHIAPRVTSSGTCYACAKEKSNYYSKKKRNPQMLLNF